MTDKSDRLKGLYVITDPELFTSLQRNINDIVSDAIRGGARIVQYRNKTSPYADRVAEAQTIQTLCAKNNVTLLVNDDIDLAMEINADGVHLGQNDEALEVARKKLGRKKIIGITCHNNVALAQQAQQDSADYVAFGRFFPSKTKPTAPPASMNMLMEASKLLNVPIVAVGGITIANAQALILNGADMLAVSHGIFGASDISAAAQQLSNLFGE